MGVTTGAATPAAASSATPAVTAADLVNQVTQAGVASPVYPGAVDPDTYLNPGDLTRSQDIADGPLPGQEFSATLPAPSEGGGYQDTSWETGHDAPQGPWDNQPYPGLPPGPVGYADTHGADTGAVYQAEHVVPPDIGRLTRRAIPGQTMNEVFQFDPVTGERLSVPNGRVNLDQYQAQNSDAFDPWEPGYSERAIYNNLAYEAAAHTGTGIYSPDGSLPDLAPHDYAAQAYQAPPDPATSVATPSSGGIGGGWVLG